MRSVIQRIEGVRLVHVIAIEFHKKLAGRSATGYAASTPCKSPKSCTAVRCRDKIVNANSLNIKDSTGLALYCFICLLATLIILSEPTMQ